MDEAKRTKVAKLKKALQAGVVMSPLRAWNTFHMAHNTYHRCIWELRHHHGMKICSRLTATNGVRHSVHWLDVKPDTNTQGG